MTRINCVPVEELHDKHLVAEYRELPRIFGLAKAAFERGEKPGELSPPFYTLGKGHVRFFYDKLDWLFHRQQALIREMERRGFSPTFKDPSILTTPLLAIVGEDWFNDWEPTEEAMTINRARIKERLETMNGNSSRI